MFHDKTLMRRTIEMLLTVALLLSSGLSEVSAAGFALLESYPAQGQVVTAADLVDKRIYLKFNHPVDRSYIGLVRLLDSTESSICQLNVCGAVHFEENDTKVVWQPRDPANLFQPGKFFQIHIGDPLPSPAPIPFAQALLRDTSGNTLPVTYIDFSLDKCQPTASLTLTSNNVLTVFCYSGLRPVYTSGRGYGIKLTAGVSNPSCGLGLTVEGKVWLRLPDGSLMSLLDPFTTAHVSPGDGISVDLLDYTFVGSEPVGHYEFGFRLVNPVTGENYSAATTGFSFGVCPTLGQVRPLLDNGTATHSG